MTIDEPPPTPKLRLVAIIWGTVGAVALVVGLVATLSAVAIFGGLALVAAVVVFAAQSYRESSAARTRRRMAGGPVSPMNAPAPVPDVGPGSVPSGLRGRSGYRRRPPLRNDPHQTAEDPAGDAPTDAETGEDADTDDTDDASATDEDTGSATDGESADRSS